MRLTGRSIWAVFALVALIGALIPLSTLQAQSSTVTISVAVSNFNTDTFSSQLITQFESSHPGIKVNVVRYDSGVPSETAGMDQYLTELGKYVDAADVVFIDPRRTPITPAATRAGYFLDLAPLVNQDTSLNVDDFFPAIWQSFQWDKGIWAMPISADAVVMSYDPSAFDKVGLAYPSEKWTMDDLTNAISKLAQKDTSGKPVAAAIGVFPASSDGDLFLSLLGDKLFDANAVPNTPQIDKPALETLVDAWSQIDQQGLIGSSNNDFQTAPMSIGPGSNLLFRRVVDPNQTPRVGLLLPGGKAGLSVQAFAVSGGTQHPEQAYALASFLTTRAEVSNRASLTPARKSLVGVQAATGGGGGGGGRGGNGPSRNISPEVQALIDKALQNAMPMSDLRYADYLHLALQKMKTDKLDAKGALQAVEAQAVQDQQLADGKKQQTAIAVATPVPTPDLSTGKVALKFGLSSFVSPLPNQDKWDKLVKDFVSADPQVAWVTIDPRPGFGGQITQFTDNYDCFYLPFNAVPTTNLGLLMNIDPFMTADKAFDPSDVVGNVMTQLQRDNKTWGLPIIIEPGILEYSSDQFNHANVPAPAGTWTIDSFKDAVKTLRPDPALPAPFVASNDNGAHLLILTAAYGGLPIDYRTNPPTINFTDQKTVDAIRQVLDLAKQGYIKYDALGNINFGGNRAAEDAAIYTQTLNSFTFRGPRPNNASNAATSYKPVTYPKGTTYNAISYTIGTAYISAKSQNPEACYRFISALSKHPDLFSAMPAHRSLINDPSVVQGTDLATLYSQIDTILKDPTTIQLPSLFGGGGGGSATGFLLPHWLYAAFDTYVLNDGDLDAALKEAEGYARGFLECAAGIAPFDPSTQNQRDYNLQFANCATKVDPRLKSLFGGAGGQ